MLQVFVAQKISVICPRGLAPAYWAAFLPAAPLTSPSAEHTDYNSLHCLCAEGQLSRLPTATCPEQESVCGLPQVHTPEPIATAFPGLQDTRTPGQVSHVALFVFVIMSSNQSSGDTCNPLDPKALA